MAEPTTLPLPSLPSTESDMASESFIVPSDSTDAGFEVQSTQARPESPASEKQGLLQALDQAHSALAQCRAENDDLKEQLAASQRQVQDQADQIAMLRGKVEEARRGVMRLQTENRRASQLQAAATSQENRTSKRASFILPPTPASPGGLGAAGKHIHRRISSMSDPGLNGELRAYGSPSSFVTSFPEHISGRLTPPGPSAEEFAKLRAELTACQQALQEATDAREASETAVRALREFIAENAVGESNSASGSEGLQGLRLPPLPTDADVADAEASAPRKPEEPKRGWGGWLKRETSSNSPKATPASGPAPSIKSAHEDEGVSATAPSASTPLTNFVSSWTRSRSSSSSVDAPPSVTMPDPAVTSPTQPSTFLKFGFFGKSANAPAAPSTPRSSTPASLLETQYEAEPEEPKPVPAPLQFHREGSVRDSMSSATASDGPEPISPPAELVDIVLHRSRLGKEEFPGERTPTFGSTTGFAI